MYFKSIEIQNVGPIDNLMLELPMDGEAPKPLILVGENGSGKSICISYLVNALLVARHEIFDDSEVEKGKVFKLRSPAYIRSGNHFSYASVDFDAGIRVAEWQLCRTREDFEREFGYTAINPEWNNIVANETSLFTANFHVNQVALNEFYSNQCCLYFPVNRFEDPAWLNIHNLTGRTDYGDLKHIAKYSNRKVICESPLRDNKNWLLDVILDRQLYETKLLPFPHTPILGAPPLTMQVFTGYEGRSTSMYEAVLRLLKVILRANGNIRLGAGPRKRRQISVIKDDKEWIPNLFHLSTGEAQLFNLFTSIIRDYDLSGGAFESLTDIRGIVIIDEIDAHLHLMHQQEVLPELISSFPNVQFIITTHAPLFLLGMDKRFGADGYAIFSLPNGEPVAATDYSELKTAYDALRETQRHRREIKAAIEQSRKPIVFVEGDYDIKYLKRAAELLGRKEVLEKFQFGDGDGYGNLDKIWRGYENKLSELLPSRILLIYDCDTRKVDANKGCVYKRVIPSRTGNPISVGIENLFSAMTIERVEVANPQFIDVQESNMVRVRGELTTLPSSKAVNKDEKKNLCEWLCREGTAEDFASFESVFCLIEMTLD